VTSFFRNVEVINIYSFTVDWRSVNIQRFYSGRTASYSKGILGLLQFFFHILAFPPFIVIFSHSTKFTLPCNQQLKRLGILIVVSELAGIRSNISNTIQTELRILNEV